MHPFIRDRFTWLAYLMLAYYAYFQAILGPIMPFLRGELGLSYTVGGLHFSAFALGMILAGLSGDLIAGRWGRRSAFWGGGLGMALGGVWLSLSGRAELTIVAVFFLGYLGSILLIIIQAALSDRHGSQRTIALTEANVMASLGAVLAPLLVGGLVGIGMGWRAALLAAGLAFFTLFIIFRSEKIPEPEKPGVLKETNSQRLPTAFWAYWAVMALAVAAEWSLVFWGADYLENAVGFTRTAAVTIMSIYFLAMIAGRLTGSRLARRIPTQALLFGSLALALVGFLLFWQAPTASLNVAGLLITGLGVANLFPATLSLAVGTAPNLADRTSARLSLSGGLAIFFAPLTLGWLADQVTISLAFGIVAILIIVATVVALIARQITKND
jgi:MFS family permease